MMWPLECAEMKCIDNLLICGICYEYMDTSVITSCSHNYCSLCIRKYLHYKTQCPTCSEETFEKDLRKNKVLDEIIIQYLSVKEKFGKKIHRGQIEAVKDENLGVTHDNTNILESEKKINVSDKSEILHEDSGSPVLTAGVSTPCGRRYYQQDVSSPSTSASPRIPSMFTPKSKKDFRNEENYHKVVVCPVCKVDVSENNINKHLDDCLKRENTKDRPKKTERKRNPLPKLVLSLMKDNVIRRKLKELRLSSQGDRKVLENRLQRYIILYNAECDKINPRPISELIKQCEEEENLEQKAQKPLNRLNINRNTEHNIIEQQRKKYLAANKQSFEQLITKIKNADRPQKSVRRDILSETNFEAPRESRIIKNDSRDNERSDFLTATDSTDSYVDDPDSGASCSSINPTNFLAIEVSSSDAETDQHLHTSKQDSSNVSCTNNSVLINSIMKTENINTEWSSIESISTCEEIPYNKLSRDLTNVSQVEKQCNISEDRMDESPFELTRNNLENNEKAELSVKRNRNNTDQEKYVMHSESGIKWKMELCNKVRDSADMEHDIADIDNIDNQLIYEGSKHEQLCNINEESNCTKFEKENVESFDENINSFRKRERETTLILSDDERIEDRSTNVRKSARLSLSEAKRYNNRNLSGNTLQENGEKSQNKREQLRASHVRNMNSFMKKSVKLRSKINSNIKK